MNIENTYCLNPHCVAPENKGDINYCQSCGFTLSLAQRYKAIKPLAKGGFGRTFLAIDLLMPSHSYCVVKQLYFQDINSENNQKIIQLFEQEAQQLEILGKHPQIPNFLAHFEQENQLYLVQEYIEGTSLSEEIWQGGKEPEQKIWQILKDILPVLQYIHDHHIIHRDIKPDNIMRRREDQKLILIDFGVSRLFTETAIIGGATVVGTPEFMSPEANRGKVLPASDLYSLGVTCLRLLTGYSTTELFDIVEEKWSWRKAIPKGIYVTHRLGKIIDKLIHPSLRYRYESANEVLKEIQFNLTETEYKIHTNLPPKKEPTPQEKFKKLSNESTELKLVSQNNQALEKSTPNQQENLINLDRLTLYLKRHDWKSADEETAELLVQLKEKKLGKYLFNSDIEKLPCIPLKMIDQLWVEYSKGHFGFSVQKQIYQEVGEDYTQFCDRIGWPAYRPSSDGLDLSFSIKAPKGNLPSRRWVGGYAWWKHAKILARKLEECGLK
jgi:serine/threonine protein kinase